MPQSELPATAARFGRQRGPVPQTSNPTRCGNKKRRRGPNTEGNNRQLEITTKKIHSPASQPTVTPVRHTATRECQGNTHGSRSTRQQAQPHPTLRIRPEVCLIHPAARDGPSYLTKACRCGHWALETRFDSRPLPRSKQQHAET